MFKHLLVPLDGSRLAEAALPAAAVLAAALDASVTLLHIIERDAPAEIHGERHLTRKDEAFAYLEEVAKNAFPPDVKVSTHVHRAEVTDVARSIVDHTDELEPDLIVMCTHGQGGLRDLLAGSIAQQVTGMGATPVLLIRPEEGAQPTPRFNRILLAMDGKTEHERGLEVVGEMAKKLNARLHLLTVIETLGTLGGKEAATGRLLPSATAAMLDLAEEGACEHLQTHLDDFAGQGVDVSAEVLRGDPAQVIAQTAKEEGDRLIVLGTHGKAGTGAFWHGSVAPRVLAQTHIPLLLIPAGKPDE